MTFFAAAASAGIQALSAIYEGNAQGAQLDAQARIAKSNARSVQLQTSANEDTQRRQNRLQMGDIRARAAATGFDPSSGSLADLQTKSAGEMELDVLTSRYEGELQALSFTNEAAMLKSQAKMSRRSGYLNAAASLASSGSSYASGQQMRKKG